MKLPAIKRILASLLFAFLLSFECSQLNAQADSTDQWSVIYLVRHAEKVDNSRDPELSEAGKMRAQRLAETLRSVNFDQIYSTDYIRTRQTALPTAKLGAKEIITYDPTALPDLARKLKATPGTYLVVGHSNTTPTMVKLLGGDPGKPIREKDEYDRLYVVNVKGGRTESQLVRYGGKVIAASNMIAGYPAVEYQDLAANLEGHWRYDYSFNENKVFETDGMYLQKNYVPYRIEFNVISKKARKKLTANNPEIIEHLNASCLSDLEFWVDEKGVMRYAKLESKDTDADGNLLRCRLKLRSTTNDEASFVTINSLSKGVMVISEYQGGSASDFHVFTREID